MMCADVHPEAMVWFPRPLVTKEEAAQHDVFAELRIGAGAERVLAVVADFRPGYSRVCQVVEDVLEIHDDLI